MLNEEPFNIFGDLAAKSGADIPIVSTSSSSAFVNDKGTGGNSSATAVDADGQISTSSDSSFVPGGSSTSSSSSSSASSDTVNTGVIVDSSIVPKLRPSDVKQSIYGSIGNDRLHGTDDSERFNGGSGDDWIWGEDGSDFIWGGSGDDVLIGDWGNDAIKAGQGDDRFRGGIGSDRLNGQNGNDVIIGGEDSDILIGGSQNDILRGDAGDDVLLGGSGDDVLIGGDGQDILTGDFGADVFVVKPETLNPELADIIVDFNSNERDLIQLSGGLAFRDITFQVTDYDKNGTLDSTLIRSATDQTIFTVVLNTVSNGQTTLTASDIT